MSAPRPSPVSCIKYYYLLRELPPARYIVRLRIYNGRRRFHILYVCSIKLYNNNNNIVHTHTGKADFYRGKSVLDRDDTDNGREREREREINARTR